MSHKLGKKPFQRCTTAINLVHILTHTQGGDDRLDLDKPWDAANRISRTVLCNQIHIF